MKMKARSSSGEVGRHVAVCPYPDSSHPATLLQLSRKIAASSPGVHVSFFTTESSAASLSTTSSGEDLLVRIRVVEDGLQGQSVASVQPFESMRRFMEAAGESLRRGMAEAEDEVGVKIGCVVADAFLSCVCRDIALQKAAKWVAIWTSPATALASHMYTDHLRTTIHAQGGIEACKDKSVDSYIGGFPAVPMECLPREVVVADISSTHISRMLHQMSHILPSAAAVAVNSTDTLEPDANNILNSAFGDIFLAAGPFSLTLSLPETAAPEDPEGCLPWLDTQALGSVLYISFGTAFMPSEEEFQSLAEALEEAGLPFVWSLPERFRAWLPEGFVGRSGKAVAWAPQTSVLAHKAVGAQLTHCGWNSVTESVVSGVPLICRALPMAEQRLNQRLVVDVWGIGVQVEGGKLTRTGVIRAVHRVLGEEEGPLLRDRITDVKKLVEEAAASDPQGTSIRNLNKFINIIITD